jgi:hypothetical protein
MLLLVCQISNSQAIQHGDCGQMEDGSPLDPYEAGEVRFIVNTIIFCNIT